MLESRFSAVGIRAQYGHHVIDGRVELGALADRGHGELGGRGTQRGLELRPRALFILELLNELAVLGFPLLFRRWAWPSAPSAQVSAGLSAARGTKA